MVDFSAKLVNSIFSVEKNERQISLSLLFYSSTLENTHENAMLILNIYFLFKIY